MIVHYCCDMYDFNIDTSLDLSRHIGREPRTRSEIFEQEVAARVASPVIATLRTIENVVFLPFTMAQSVVQGFVTLNPRQIVSVAWMPIASVVTLFALPLIGLIGLLSPTLAYVSANWLGIHLDRFDYQIPYKDQTSLQRRIMLAVNGFVLAIPFTVMALNSVVISLIFLRSDKLEKIQKLCVAPFSPLISLYGAFAAE